MEGWGEAAGILEKEIWTEGCFWMRYMFRKE